MDKGKKMSEGGENEKLEQELSFPGYEKLMKAEAENMLLNEIGEDGKVKVELAIEVIYSIAEYAKNEGFVGLSEDEAFRQVGEYVLDIFEREKECDIPLKDYLQSGLEIIADGRAEEVEDIMGSGYLVRGYAGADCVIAYMYLAGILKITQGICPAEIDAHLKSFLKGVEKL